MAGKPEEIISHPASLNRISYQHHQKAPQPYHLHHHQQQQQQHDQHPKRARLSTITKSLTSPGSTTVESIHLQKNQKIDSSLYDQSEKFTYATPIIHQNDAASCEIYADPAQRLAISHHPPNLSSSQSSRVIPESQRYSIDETGAATTAATPLDPSPRTIEIEDHENSEAIPKSSSLVSINSIADRHIDDTGIITSDRRTLVNSYCNLPGARGHQAGYEIANRVSLSVGVENFPQSSSPSQSDRDSLSGKSDEDPSISTVTTTRTNSLIGNAGVANRNDNNAKDSKDLGCPPALILNTQLSSENHLTYAEPNVIGTDCSYTIGNDGIAIVGSANTIGSLNSGLSLGYDGHRRFTYSRPRSQAPLGNCKINCVARNGADDDALDRRNRETTSLDNSCVSLRRCHSASLDMVETSSCISNSSNSSNSSGSGSSSCSGSTSGRSSASILDGNDCQGRSASERDHVAPCVSADQVARSMTQVIGQQQQQQHHNIGLAVNDSVVTQQQQQRQQQLGTICEPRGWKRISTNNVIIYIR